MFNNVVYYMLATEEWNIVIFEISYFLVTPSSFISELRNVVNRNDHPPLTAQSYQVVNSITMLSSQLRASKPPGSNRTLWRKLLYWKARA